MRFFLFAFLLACVASLVAGQQENSFPMTSPQSISSTSAIAYSEPEPPANPKTLVLLDDISIKETHSIFFNQLRKRGHELTFILALDDHSSNRLEKYGKFHYDNLILFSPKAEDFGEGLSVRDVLNFIDSGRNVLIAGDDVINEPIRELLAELNIDIHEEGSIVQDSRNFDSALGYQNHDVIATRNVLANSSRILSEYSKTTPFAPVLFRGIGHSAPHSELVLRFLSGMETTFSYLADKPVNEYPFSTGADTALVTGIQTRTNSRVLFSGSLSLFSNLFLSASIGLAIPIPGTRTTRFPLSGNEAFVSDVASWTFEEKGLLRVRNFVHKIKGSDEANPKTYRVNDWLEFSCVIEEYDGAADTWKPFVADDVQVEFFMIDPYIRTTLKQNGNGLYSISFQVPDVYGVYKLILDYTRQGFSHLEYTAAIGVRPYRHDEYERFIPQAYPYYLSAITLMSAFFLFGIIFLYSKEKKQ